MKLTTSNCFVCAIRPTLYTGSISNAFANAYCLHSTPPTTPNIKTSKLRRHIGMYIYAIFGAIGLYEFHYNTNQGQLGTLRIVRNCELVGHLFGLWRLFLNNLVWRKKRIELNVMVSIAEYLKAFNIDTSKAYGTFSRQTKIVSWFWTGMNLYTAYCIIQENYSWFGVLFAINKIVLSTVVVPLYWQAMVEYNFYKVFLEVCYVQIEREVKTRLTKEETRWYHEVVPLQSFPRKLRKLRRLYLMIVLSLKRTNSLYRSTLLLVAFMFFVIVLLLSYAAVVVWLYEGQLDLLEYVLLVRFSIYALCVYYFSLVCDSLPSMSDDVLTFLFKVPISKLDNKEGDELESLIKTIRWEKPICNAFNMITHGKDLLTSIITNIITYSLVLIQLYIYFAQLEREALQDITLRNHTNTNTTQ